LQGKRIGVYKKHYCGFVHIGRNMQEHPNLIVMQGTSAPRDTLICELAAHAFAVRSCGSMPGFRHLYRAAPAPLVVLVGPVDFLATNVIGVRELAPAAALIALGADDGAAWRMRVMRAGADACHAATIDIRELTAILNAWRRRSVPPPGAAPASSPTSRSWPVHPAATEGWSLSVSQRMLACPMGRILALTRSESGFLQRLVGNQGQLLRRNERDASTVPSPRLVARSIDVLVSRLRRKARQNGMELPLMAVHGCGYLFAERLEMAG
jgi:DNA-binding response OmpR family regulator